MRTHWRDEVSFWLVIGVVLFVVWRYGTAVDIPPYPEPAPLRFR